MVIMAHNNENKFFGGYEAKFVICEQLAYNIREIGKKRWTAQSVENYVETVWSAFCNSSSSMNEIDNDLVFFNTMLKNTKGDFIYLCKIINSDESDKNLTRIYYITIHGFTNKLNSLEENYFYLEQISLANQIKVSRSCNNGINESVNLNDLWNNIKVGDYNIYELGQLSKTNLGNNQSEFNQLYNATKHAIEKDIRIFRKLINRFTSYPDDILPDFGSIDYDKSMDFCIGDIPQITDERERRELRRYILENCGPNCRDVKMILNNDTVYNLFRAWRGISGINRSYNRLKYFRGIDHIVIDGIDNLPLTIRYKLVNDTSDMFNNVKLQLALLTDDNKYNYVKRMLEEAIRESTRKVKSRELEIAPMYYKDNSRIQYLFPLFFDNDSERTKCTCAVIMDWNPDNKTFTPRTLLNMFEAYTDVRVVDDPDKYDWLDY